MARGISLSLPNPQALAGGPLPAGGWFGGVSPSGGPVLGRGLVGGGNAEGVDRVTAGQLAELSALKAEAIREEDYDEAKRIKVSPQWLTGD